MSTMGYVTTLTGAEDAASLSLDFEKQNYRVMEGGKLVSKQFSEFFSFARSTSGGRYNEKGLYESVPAGQPRFDYDPITKVLKGLLVEEQRTNLRTSSQMYGWSSGGSGTVISEPPISPDGTLTGISVANTPGAGSFINKAFSAPAGIYTHSVFLKADGETFSVVFSEVKGAGNVTFNVVTKVFSGGAARDKGYTDVGNGWVRAWVTTESEAQTATTLYIGLYGSTNVLHKGAIWGYQVELGAFPTTYMPTPEIFTSRASTATYFDKNGVLKTADVNVARSGTYMPLGGEFKPAGLLLEGASTNRLKVPNNFELAQWIKPSSTMALSSGSVSPAGSTSNRITLLSNQGHNINQALDTALLVGTTYTLSIWVKAVKGSFPFQLGYYDLSANLNATNITPTEEWARYSYTFTPTVLATSPQVRLIGFQQGLDGDQVDIWGAQLEVGRSPSSFIYANPTFTSRESTATYIDSSGIIQTAANNVARDQAYGYDSSGVLRPIGLLLEGSATNLLSYSDNYVTGTAGTWGNSGPGTLPLTVTPSAANGTRGEGTMTLMARQDLGVKYLFKAFTAGARTIITRTQRIKAVGASPAGTCLTMRLQTESYANRVDAWFNVTTGVCAAQGIGDCEVIGVSMVKERDGVWLCTLTGKSGVGAWGSVAMSALDRAGTTDSTPASVCSLYIDTAQCEIGSSATSYIPTTTTTVTRAADVYSSTTSTRAADVSTSVAATRVNDSAPILDMTPWYNQIASSFKVEFTPGPIGVGTTNLAFYTRSSLAIANSLTIVRRGPDVTEAAGIISRPDGSVQMIASDKGSVNTGVRIKACISYKLNSAAFATQGKAPILDSTVELPTPDWMFVGNNGSNSQNLNGHIHSLQYYPVRLSDAQTQLITA